MSLPETPIYLGLMLRSAAKQRVSKHEAATVAALSFETALCASSG